MPHLYWYQLFQPIGGVSASPLYDWLAVLVPAVADL
jgi:hypothetical protein